MMRIDLDTALKEIGRIGRYQVFVYTLIGIPLLLSGTYGGSYVFTAGDLNYRCRIDDCDRVNNPNCEYLTDWLRNAVPYNKDSDKPEQCLMYNLTNRNSDDLKCMTSDFNRVQLKCTDFVYEDDERTIVNDMNLHCDENKWLLALVGTIPSVAIFINLLISGYFSDKYGRRAVLIFSAIASGTLGIARSFTENYISFILLEFFDALLGAGLYASCFILAMEIVKPGHRAISGGLIFAMSSFGKVLLGTSAMIFKNWRTLLRVNLPFSYITLTYFWIVPESMRWLLSQDRNVEAAKGLLKITNINKNQISVKLRDLLENRPNDLVLNQDNDQSTDRANTSQDNYNFKLVFKYPKMLIRLVMCSCLWIIIVMVFYGLSLIAVSIGGNKYTDYMLVQFIEIPAALLMPFISNRFGRRKVLWISFVLSGVTLVVYAFVGDTYGIKLTLFLLGKFAISCAFANIYIYNSEMFPTNLRQTLLGICSAFGRIGSIVAPQAPLLNFYVKNLSMYIFGGSALIGAIVTLQLPETLHTKLPDTIEEALNIGKLDSVEKSKYVVITERRYKDNKCVHL